MSSRWEVIRCCRCGAVAHRGDLVDVLMTPSPPGWRIVWEGRICPACWSQEKRGRVVPLQRPDRAQEESSDV